MKFEDVMEECANDYIDKMKKAMQKESPESVEVFLEHALFKSFKDTYKHGFEMSRKLSIQNEQN